jgi:hypothetical protein
MPEGPLRVPEHPIIPAPEHGPVGVESQTERRAPAVDHPSTSEPTATVTPLLMPQPMVPVIPTILPLTQEVESILSAGLEETYKKLDPATQQKFRLEGERTAATISLMMQSAKLQVHKVVELILTWLKIIPGVNRFFLEQEAKIKADKILTLRQPPQP